MSAPEQKLSQVSSVDGQSPRGLINTEEAMKSLDKGGAWAVLMSAAGGCLFALATDFHLWYDGPFKAALGMMVGAWVVWYTARRQAKRFAEMGDDIDADRK